MTVLADMMIFDSGWVSEERRELEIAGRGVCKASVRFDASVCGRMDNR